MTEGRSALLEQLRHFHSLIRAKEFDVAAFLSLFTRIFDCEVVCILQVACDEQGEPYLRTVYHPTGAAPLDDIRLSGEDVFTRALDKDEFALLGPEPCSQECPEGLLGQGIRQCILGPIDVVEVTKELIVIGSDNEQVRLDLDDVPLAEMLSYFLSLKFVERQLQRETQILERAADLGFNLSLRNHREL